jgi:biopolymer transport protein ExbB/TolQ
VGPMLGLVGTLIPLQPALAGLAKGDMQAMASNLQIGFTTTVLGLLVGGACYAVSVVMRGWYQQDLADMSFLLALWLPEENGAPGTRDSGESSRLTPVRLESK